MPTHLRRLAYATAVALTACSSDPRPADQADAGTDAAMPGHVMTDRGPIIGHSDGTITAFLGVPYAAPPIGALRWRAPEAHAAWTAPLDAATLGPACAQSDGGIGQTGPYSEDCLTVNVWSPNAAAHAPVMVFLHGGVFVHGSSNQPGYDGRALAAAGVVAVTLNYRLGVLGFLAHPALTAEDAHHSSGNTGLLDQQAALRWVHNNIAALGGDPANVTVFGESAGSMSVCTHLVSPLAAGLFRRAIGESGSCVRFATPLHSAPDGTQPGAESLGILVAQNLGCDTADDVLACMRGASVDDVIAAAPGAEDVVPAGVHLAPNVDGYVLPEPPGQAFAAGRLNALDGFLAGTNRDEGTLFTRMKTIDTEADYEAAMAALVPAHTSDLIALYPPASYPTFVAAYDAALTDLVFVCQTRAQVRALAAHGTPTYLYLFTKLTAFGSATGLGVYHGSELPFVFGNLTAVSGMTADDRALSSQVVGAWTRFAATGDPNAAGAASWPPNTTASDAYLEIGEPIQAGTGLHASTCDAIEQWR